MAFLIQNIWSISCLAPAGCKSHNIPRSSSFPPLLPPTGYGGVHATLQPLSTCFYITSTPELLFRHLRRVDKAAHWRGVGRCVWGVVLIGIDEQQRWVGENWNRTISCSGNYSSSWLYFLLKSSVALLCKSFLHAMRCRVAWIHCMALRLHVHQFYLACVYHECFVVRRLWQLVHLYFLNLWFHLYSWMFMGIFVSVIYSTLFLYLFDYV